METVAGVIIIVIYLLLACLPAFLMTWERSAFEGCGAFLWCLIGLPGAILAIIIKGVLAIFKLPSKNREREKQTILACQEETERQKREAEKRRKEIEHQKHLDDMRRIFQNSPVTKEIVEIITGENELPYSIDLNNTGLKFYFENSTRAFVYASHGLPDMGTDEEKMFAKVLNQKLGNQYLIDEMSKYHSFTHSDGTQDGCSIHIGTRMKLKATRTF